MGLKCVKILIRIQVVWFERGIFDSETKSVCEAVI